MLQAASRTYPRHGLYSLELYLPFAKIRIMPLQIRRQGYYLYSYPAGNTCTDVHEPRRDAPREAREKKTTTKLHDWKVTQIINAHEIYIEYVAIYHGFYDNMYTVSIPRESLDC